MILAKTKEQKVFYLIISLEKKWAKTFKIKGVFFWLKNLRLHKYSNILCPLSYDELINLTDEKLISHQITLGARRKILQNIEKLKQRNEKLDEITNVK